MRRMRIVSLVFAWAMFVLAAGCTATAPDEVLDATQRYTQILDLPEPDRTGEVSLEQSFVRRRSLREYAPEVLPIGMIGQLFWAAQGITDDAGHRTAPSAGALYPLEVYALTGTVFMHYLPPDHSIEQRQDKSTLAALTAAAFNQQFVSEAPTVLVITGVQARTEAKYGAVAGNLMNREAGHVAQNILLQATALNISAVPVGGFDPVEVERLLALPLGEEVLYLIPVGFPPGGSTLP